MSSIYDYEERLIRYWRTTKPLRNGEVALCFLDHMGALAFRDCVKTKIVFRKLLSLCIESALTRIFST